MNKFDQDRLIQEHSHDAIERRLSKTPKSQNVSDAVLGGIDGCVTTFAVVSGTVGAGLPASVALIMGFANLIADGFSMGISNYEANKANIEFKESVKRSEQVHIDQVPEGEREEIRQIYQNKGFSGSTLETIVQTLCRDRALWVETMLTEEHGLYKNAPKPFVSAITTFVAFIVVGTVPLLPFLINSLETSHTFIFSAGLAGLMFFLIGMAKSLVVTKPLFRSGLWTLVTGGTAASLAFITGYLLRAVFGITGA